MVPGCCLVAKPLPQYTMCCKVLSREHKYFVTHVVLVVRETGSVLSWD